MNGVNHVVSLIFQFQFFLPKQHKINYVYNLLRSFISRFDGSFVLFHARRDVVNKRPEVDCWCMLEKSKETELLGAESLWIRSGSPLMLS